MNQLSPANYRDLKAMSSSFDAWGAFAEDAVNLVGGGRFEDDRQISRIDDVTLGDLLGIAVFLITKVVLASPSGGDDEIPF